MMYVCVCVCVLDVCTFMGVCVSLCVPECPFTFMVDIVALDSRETSQFLSGRMVRRKRRVSVTFRVVRRQFRTIKRDKTGSAPKGGVEQATAGTSKLALK